MKWSQDRNRNRSHRGILPTWFLPMAYAPCVLYLRAICPRVLPPVMKCSPLPPANQTLTKKMPHRLACRLILWRHFSTVFSCSQIALVCVMSVWEWAWKCRSQRDQMCQVILKVETRPSVMPTVDTWKWTQVPLTGISALNFVVISPAPYFHF